MPCDRKSMRYGHSEGHTEVCFDCTGNLMVTSGADGDVRVWAGLDDDDPKSITVGDRVHSMALKNKKLVTAVSNNSVQIHTFPDGEPDGIITRFSNAANHVSFNHSGSQVAAASSDFLVKVVEVSNSSQQKTLRGHQAPVLSVTFDPQDEFVASASCDGSVVVWSIEQQTPVIILPLLHKTNEVNNAKSLCRLSWQPGTGELLAIPVDCSVCLYQRGSWQLIGSLSDDQLTQPVNVVCWSPCSRLLAAGSVGGSLTVWDVNSRFCVERQKHEKGFTVCSLAWHPSGSQLAFTDTEGCLGLLDALYTPSTGPPPKVDRDYDGLFDEEDGGVMDEERSYSPLNKAAEDDDDDVMPASARLRKRAALMDDNSQDAVSLRDDDDDDVVPAPAAPLAPLCPAYDGLVPTPLQKAFQPGSTPNHLSHRFMVWNSVGIVRQYNDEQDNAIDVEFHDSAVHHAMHVSNTLGHTMADISQEAVLLACPSTEQLASKLQCLHFSSWDSSRDWVVDLPPGEEAVCVCLGEGWGAVASSTQTLRLFSVGGLQREIISLPGPAVCMSGQGGQLMVVYHRGSGFNGDQALQVLLLHVGPTKKKILNESLPLSPKSYLTWLGFTAEGTPAGVDSVGVVRMLNRSLGGVWTPVCDTRQNCRNQSDHLWVVGVHENPQQLRCVPCKGSRYPPTLPRPTVTILNFNLPLCQSATEKSQLEENFWRSRLFNNHFLFLSDEGYEVDEDARRRAETEQQELLMKLFALSCKLDREFRCVELAQMMSHSVVTLAIRYASRSRRMALAQRLSELALHKANQLQQGQSEEEQELIYARHSGGADEDIEVQDRKDVCEGEDRDTEKTRNRRLNPFSKDEELSVALSVTPTGKVGRSNPFKVGVSQKVSPSQPRAANILDSMSSRKSSSLTGSADKPKHSVQIRPLPPRAKTKTQSTLKMSKTDNEKTKNAERPVDAPPTEALPPPSPDNPENQRRQTGFQLWLEENKEQLLKDQPNMDHSELIRDAMTRFRTLSAAHRLTWTQRARGHHGNPNDEEVTKTSRGPHGNEDDDDGDRKRKRDEDEDPSSIKKKAPDVSSKLSAFSFNNR